VGKHGCIIFWSRTYLDRKMQTDRHKNQPTTGFVFTYHLAKMIHGNVYMTYYFFLFCSTDLIPVFECVNDDSNNSLKNVNLSGKWSFLQKTSATKSQTGILRVDWSWMIFSLSLSLLLKAQRLVFHWLQSGHMWMVVCVLTEQRKRRL